jgi:hypothetical protein
MERKKEKKIWYRKRGGGSLYLTPPEGSTARRGQKVKSNEKFQAFPSQIPEAFRDTCIPLEDVDVPSPPVEKKKPAPPVKEEYTLDSLPGGWYNILDSEGKKVNESSLRKEKAEEFLKSLTE